MPVHASPRQAELRITQHLAEIVLQKNLLRTLLHVCQSKGLSSSERALSFAFPLAKSKTRTRSSTELLKQPGP